MIPLTVELEAQVIKDMILRLALDSIQSQEVQKITERTLGSLTLLRSNGQEGFVFPLVEYGDRWDMIDIVVGSQPNSLNPSVTLRLKSIAPEHIQVFMKEDCK